MVLGRATFSNFLFSESFFSLLLSCFIGLPIYAVEPGASVATSADEIFSALSESLFQIRIVEKNLEHSRLPEVVLLSMKIALSQISMLFLRLF